MYLLRGLGICIPLEHNAFCNGASDVRTAVRRPTTVNHPAAPHSLFALQQFRFNGVTSADQIVTYLITRSDRRAVSGKLEITGKSRRFSRAMAGVAGQKECGPVCAERSIRGTHYWRGATQCRVLLAASASPDGMPMSLRHCRR